MKLLPLVLHIIKVHLHADGTGTKLFKWDTGLVGDGCFFAGFLAAGGERDHCAGMADADALFECTFKQEDTEAGLRQDEGVEVCLRALREMRWAFAKAEEREQTIQMVWEARRTGARQSLVREYPAHGSLELDGAYHHTHNHDAHTVPHQLQHAQYAHVGDKTLLPPLNLTLPARESFVSTHGTTSAPHTGGTDGSGSGWPTYTPPGTGTSGSGSTGFSVAGSPVYSSMPGAHLQVYHKAADMNTGDVFYQTHPGAVEIDPFSFSVPVTGYHLQRGHQSQTMHTGSNFLDPVFGGAGSSVIVDSRLHTASDEGSGCSQFGDECATYYHH